MTNVFVIGLAGLARCGKNEYAEMLRTEFEANGDVGVVYPMAKPLKDASAILLNLSYEDMNGEGIDRDAPLPQFSNGVSVRTFLQLLGTEFARNMIDQSFWTNHARDYIRNLAKTLDLPETKTLYVLIPDVRFDNEAAMITDDLDGMVMRIFRPGLTKMDHASEAGISEDYIFTTIRNDGTIDDLRDSAKRFAKRIANY